MAKAVSRRKKGVGSGALGNLTKEHVLQAAVSLADLGDIESLSMRKLGQELGVEAMSLYHYVANKNDLLDDMADFVVSEFELPSSAIDWKSAVRGSAMSAHKVLWSHPWACRLKISRPGAGPAALHYIDALMGCLRQANFSTQLTHDAHHAIFSHIYGFTLQELGIKSGIEFLDPEEVKILFLQMKDQYPHLVEVARGAKHDHKLEFAFVLDLILDGLERARDGSQ